MMRLSRNVVYSGRRFRGNWLLSHVLVATLLGLTAWTSPSAAAEDRPPANDPSPRDQLAYSTKHASSTKQPRHVIGAVATITEATSGLPLLARVDTGATTCSIHCETLEILNSAPDPKDNIGKRARILIKNKRGESNWVQATIADHVTIRNAETEEDRYKVRMVLRWRDLEKRVLVTLNDRAQMTYPVLIGRNFLRDDFLVNVNLLEEN